MKRSTMLKKANKILASVMAASMLMSTVVPGTMVYASEISAPDVETEEGFTDGMEEMQENPQDNEFGDERESGDDVIFSDGKEDATAAMSNGTSEGETVSESTTWENKVISSPIYIVGGTEEEPVVIKIKGTVTVCDVGEIACSGYVKFTTDENESESGVIKADKSGGKSIFTKTDPDGNTIWSEKTTNISFENIVLDGNKNNVRLIMMGSNSKDIKIIVNIKQNTTIKNFFGDCIFYIISTVDKEGVQINIDGEHAAIKDNTCFCIFAALNAILNMSNGKIQDNNGIIINPEWPFTFNMKDGEITNNSTNYRYGLIFIDDEKKFNMCGGKISNNNITGGDEAAAVMVGGGTFNIDGTAEVVDNTGGNIYLYSDDNERNMFKIAQDFSGKAGVRVNSELLSAGKLAQITVNGEENEQEKLVDSNIFSDMDSAGIVYDNKHLSMKKHSHVWKYEQSDDEKTVKATCIEEFRPCEYNTNPLSMTIKAQEKTYDGSPYDARNVEITGQEDFENATERQFQLTFYNKDCTEKIENGPVNCGDYYAALEDKTNEIVIKAPFSIKPAAMQVTADDVLCATDGQPHTITVNVVGPENHTIKYSETENGDYTLNTCPSIEEAGTKTIYYEVTADNYATVRGKANITLLNAITDQTEGNVNITMAVNIGEGVPDTEIKGLTKQSVAESLNESDKAAIADGQKILVYPEIKDVTETTNKENVQNFLKTNGYNAQAQYFGVSLYKKLENNPVTIWNGAGVPEFTGTMSIPEGIRKPAGVDKRTYYMLCVSDDGTIEKVAETTGNAIEFKCDKLGTYVLAYKDTYYVAPSYPVTGITASTDKISLTEKGASADITVTVTPSYADNKNVTWKSSDESVATVDKNGKVTAVGNGTATITATTVSGNYTATVTVTVNIPEEKPAIDKITMTPDKKTLTKIGESTQINLKIEPENADAADLIWKSSDEKVAVVDANGKVTAVGNGTATITVSAKDGKYTTDVTITVKVPDEPTVNNTTGFGRLKARSVTQTNSSVKVEWTRVEGADGYVVYGNLCNGNGKVYKYQKLTTITNGKTRSWTQTGLKKGTYYKYIVKAYKLVNGKKVITDTSASVHTVTAGGKYGVAKSVSVTKIGNKKNTLKVTLKTGKTAQITAKEVKKDKPIKHHRNLCYETSNSEVATVTPDGMITATGKGTCTVWVYAQNGVYRAITVTVK